MREVFKAGNNCDPCDVLHLALEKVSASAYYTKMVPYLRVMSARCKKSAPLGQNFKKISKINF